MSDRKPKPWHDTPSCECGGPITPVDKLYRWFRCAACGRNAVNLSARDINRAIAATRAWDREEARQERDERAADKRSLLEKKYAEAMARKRA